MPNLNAIAILSGLVSAGLYLALLSGLSGVIVFAYFVQLPLMFSGLSAGFGGALVAAGSAIVVTAVVADLTAALLFLLVQALPALFLVRQALLFRQVDGQTEWFPPGLLLAQLTVAAALVIALAFVAFLGEPEGLKGAIENYIGAALETFESAMQADVEIGDIQTWSFLIPAMMAISWLLMTIVNGILGQALAVRSGRARRPSPVFAEMELPWWLWPPLGVAAALALLGGSGLGYLGRAVLLVLVVPYALLGLAVIHAWMRRLSHPRLALAAVYVSLMVLGWPILIVILLGFAEDWANLRRRFV